MLKIYFRGDILLSQKNKNIVPARDTHYCLIEKGALYYFICDRLRLEYINVAAEENKQ